MSNVRAGRWQAPVLWTVYVLLPAPGWGLFGGIPLSPLADVTLAAVWLAHAMWRTRNLAIPVVLIALKAGFGSFAVMERGLTAEYYANDSLTPPIERSTEHPHATFTRIDQTLDFGPAADRDLPLFFLNDVGRFNYYQPTEPARTTLAYSVSWAGNLLVSRDGTETAILRGSGLRGELAIDGRIVATLLPDSVDSRATVSLSKGWRRLRVTAWGPYGAQRAFYAGLIDQSGRARPFSEDNVFVHRPADWPVRADRIVRQASRLLDVLALGWLAANICRAVAAAFVTSALHATAAGLAIAVLIDAWYFAIGSANRLILLPAGDDPLTFESYARDILLNGPLMTLGHALGRGEAFYYQPLYPYVLALVHRVSGEGFFGVLFVQRLLVGVSVALVWRMTHAMFGERIGFVSLSLAAIFLYGKLGHWSGMLLGEIVFIPLVCLWACQLIGLIDAGSHSAAARAGIAGGVATLGRSTLLLAWPFVALALTLGRKRVGRAGSPVATMVVAGLIVVSLATVRNWIVARTFVPVTTSFAVNLYLGNRPPEGLEVPLHTATDDALYKWIAPEDRIRMVLEFAVHAPAAFARNLLNKALYALGFFGAFVSGAKTDPTFVMLWVTSLAGGLVLWKIGIKSGRAGFSRAIPAIIATSHLASIIIIFPHHDRLILPFYVLILPYAAAATALVIVDPRSRSEPTSTGTTASRH